MLVVTALLGAVLSTGEPGGALASEVVSLPAMAITGVALGTPVAQELVPIAASVRGQRRPRAGLARKAPRTKIVLESFKGRRAGTVRGAVVRALRRSGRRIEFVTPAVTGRVARRLRVSTRAPEGRARVAAELGVVVWAGARLEPPRGLVANLELVPGFDGSPVEAVKVSAATSSGVAAELARAILSHVEALSKAGEGESLFADGRGPPGGGARGGVASDGDPSSTSGEPPEGERLVVAPGPDGSAGDRSSEGAPPPAAEAMPKPLDSAEGSGVSTPSASISALEAEAGLFVFSRSYGYRGDEEGLLRPYRLSAAFAPRLGVRWFPGAHFGSGPAAYFGLAATGEFALALDSRSAEGAQFPTRAFAWQASVIARLPFLGHEVAAAAGVGQHVFSVGRSADGTDPDLPSVGYRFLRLGLDARFVFFERLHLRLGGGFRLLGDLGAVGREGWFPQAGGYGLDAEGGVGVAIGLGLSVDALFHLRRFMLSLRSEPDDARRASSAVDQVLGGTLSLTWRL